MNIRSFYMNMRRRWGFSYVIWNKFFDNIKADLESFKDEIDDHGINTEEDDLQASIDKYVTKEDI